MLLFTAFQAAEFALKKLNEEEITNGAENVSVSGFEGVSENMIDDLINRSLSGNDVIIAVSALYNNSKLDPSTEAGLCSQYGPNIPAAIHAIFGGSDITGRLPVNIPEINAKFDYSDRILYEIGTGISLLKAGKDSKKTLNGNNSLWQEAVLGNEQFDEYMPLLKDKRVALFSNHFGIVVIYAEKHGRSAEGQVLAGSSERF